MGKGIFSQYWGKTVREDSKEASCHLLIWHSLDVAAVASSWWDCSPSIRSFFCRKSPSLDEAKVKAWILFFIALHDIGKFDTRFQCKSVETWRTLFPEAVKLSSLDYDRCKGFDHGAGGLYWFIDDYQPMLEEPDFNSFYEPEPHPYHSWIPWIEAVTGHHGYIRSWHELDNDRLRWPSFLSPLLADFDKQARREWIAALEALFLLPAGLSVNAEPPEIPPLLAGFCSIADWLGSWNSDDAFHFCAKPPATFDDLPGYFSQ